MTESEMRDADAPWPKSWEELKAYCESLFINENNDYGKAAYCMSLATTAMFNFAADRVGATGFLASCADMDFLRRSRGMKNGFQIVDYNNFLYPQYMNRPEIAALFPKIAPRLIKEAKRLLEENGGGAHEDVLAHWKRIATMPEPTEDA